MSLSLINLNFNFFKFLESSRKYFFHVLAEKCKSRLNVSKLSADSWSVNLVVFSKQQFNYFWSEETRVLLTFLFVKQIFLRWFPTFKLQFFGGEFQSIISEFIKRDPVKSFKNFTLDLYKRVGWTMLLSPSCFLASFAAFYENICGF